MSRVLLGLRSVSQSPLPEDSMCFSKEEREFRITVHMPKPTEEAMTNTQRKTQLNFAVVTYENRSSSAAPEGLGMLRSKNEAAPRVKNR